MTHIDEIKIKIICDECGAELWIYIADPFYLHMVDERLKHEAFNNRWTIDEYGNWFCKECKHGL